MTGPAIITPQQQGFPRLTPDTSSGIGISRKSSLFVWPATPGKLSNGEATDQTNPPARNALTTFPTITTVAVGAGGTSKQPTPFDGMTGIWQGTSATAGTGILIVSSAGMAPRFPIVASANFAPPSCDYFRAWRMTAHMQFSGTPAADSDYGLALLAPASETNADSIIATGLPGIAWYRTADGNVSLYISGPSGVVKTPITTPGFDPTIFHVYELRMVGAYRGIQAYMRALVDGQNFAYLSWGPSTILPSPNASHGQWKWQLCNLAGASLQLNVIEATTASSNTEQGTL